MNVPNISSQIAYAQHLSSHIAFHVPTLCLQEWHVPNFSFQHCRYQNYSFKICLHCAQKCVFKKCMWLKMFPDEFVIYRATGAQPGMHCMEWIFFSWQWSRSPPESVLQRFVQIKAHHQIGNSQVVCYHWKSWPTEKGNTLKTMLIWHKKSWNMQFSGHTYFDCTLNLEPMHFGEANLCMAHMCNLNFWSPYTWHLPNWMWQISDTLTFRRTCACGSTCVFLALAILAGAFK